MNEVGTRPNRWKNPLWTCGIGCGAALIIAVVALGGLYFWAVSPGPQIPTQRVLGPESLAFFRIDQVSNDEGFQSMATDILLELQGLELERSSREMPMMMGWLRQTRRQSPQQVVDNLKRDLPRDITATLEAQSEPGQPAFTVAVNLSRYPRLIRFFFNWFAQDFTAQIEKQFPGARLEFVENTMIWAQTPEALASVLERARRPVPPTPSTPLLRMLDEGSAEWDFYGGAENRDGLMLQAARRLSELPPDFPLKVPPEAAALLQEAKSVMLGIDIASRELVRVRLDVELSSESAAQPWEKLLRDFVRVNEPAADHPLKLAAEVVRSPSHVTLEMNFTEVKAALLQAIRTAAAEDEGRTIVPSPERAPGNGSRNQ